MKRTRVEIILTLDGECIESAAKRRYRELLEYLLKHDDREKEKELEAITTFLSNANFQKLRSDGLDGRSKRKVRVSVEGGTLKIDTLQ